MWPPAWSVSRTSIMARDWDGAELEVGGGGEVEEEEEVEERVERRREARREGRMRGMVEGRVEGMLVLEFR